MATDKDGNKLIPGHVYCMISLKPEYDNQGEPTGEMYEDYGSLAWFASDGHFYDANYDDCEGEDISHHDYDSLVLQSGNVNPEYVFEVAA